ncbi:hypothetical protein E4U21_003655 [Claviceps maximensis]|nr:hypothetical protein E4U21_003655 [Claviceps maximensis]
MVMEVEMTIRLMPGSFGDEDMAALHDNAFKSVQVTQDDGRMQSPTTASWSSGNRFDMDIGDVDWHRYEPPTALHKAHNVTSLTLMDILTQSIVNVKTRVAEEDHSQSIEKERIRRVEEEKATTHDESPEPYLPIIIPAEQPLEPDISSMNNMYNRADVTSTSVIAASKRNNVAAVHLLKDKKNGGWRRNAFRRFFQKAPESGESSSVGGAREALRQKLEARLSRVDITTTDSVTQEALLALRKSGFIADAEQPKPVAEVLILRNIPDDLKKTFQERSLEWELPIGERMYCSEPECGIWIPPKQIKLHKRQGRCERGHFTCTICRGPLHGDDDCPQDYEMTLTNILAEQEGWKRCFNCYAMVEHREACEHMTCRCGAEFCYVCGLRWKTCRCTVEQLNELKEAAARRREQRRVKDELEAEELRAILVQIEEFEQEEAARAERERLEQERLEAERLQQQIEERIRFENVRRREIATKFVELRLHLDNIHELQNVMADAQQEERAASLLEESESAKTQLAERHEAERRRFQDDTRAKIRLKEDQFSKEYSARVATERRVEERYLQQLRDFWKGRRRAEEEIARGMLSLQTRMDQGHRAWQKWKNEQMLSYEAKLGDAQVIKEEIMYSQRERTKDLWQGKERELTRRALAEKKWFQEIVLERERLLAEREVQEVEGDADTLFAGGG